LQWLFIAIGVTKLFFIFISTEVKFGSIVSILKSWSKWCLCELNVGLSKIIAF
jgi:hypothetical protein